MSRRSLRHTTYSSIQRELIVSSWLSDFSRILDTSARSSTSSPPASATYGSPGSTSYRNEVFSALSPRPARSPEQPEPADFYNRRSSVNPLSGLGAQSVVKIHKECEPEELGVSSFSCRKVTVRSTTLKNLKIASEVLREVRHMLPHGPGNQEANVVLSKGESWARASVARTRVNRSSTVLEYARAAAEAQGGSCKEHASLAYAALSTRTINAPVMRVNDRNVDHSYVVIGDPRDPQWGERNTVVVDPWVRLPTAVTLAEGGPLGYTLGPGGDLRSVNAPPDPDATDLLSSIQPVSRAEVEQMLAENDMPAIGDALVDYIDENVKPQVHFYDIRPSARDPSVKYSDSRLSGGKTMDQMTSAALNYEKQANLALQRHRGE